MNRRLIKQSPACNHAIIDLTILPPCNPEYRISGLGELSQTPGKQFIHYNYSQRTATSPQFQKQK